MTTDIRISIEFWDHPKIKKLENRLGLEAVKSLQILWIWSAKNRPDGNLKGMDFEDIELAARWCGETGIFTKNLIELKLLDADEIRVFNEPLTTNNEPLTNRSTIFNVVNFRYSIHDWRIHNPWAAESETRSDKSRFSRLAHTCPEIYTKLLNEGRVSISKEEYEQFLAEFRKSNIVTIQNQRKIKNGTTIR